LRADIDFTLLIIISKIWLRRDRKAAISEEGGQHFLRLLHCFLEHLGEDTAKAPDIGGLIVRFNMQNHLWRSVVTSET
jgi:hypothetical protein